MIIQKMILAFSQSIFSDFFSFHTPSLRIFLLAFSLFTLSACSPEPVEGDKHPSIPVFPAHTNPHINIERLSDAQITSYGRTKNYIYTDHPDGMQIYDLNFTPIHLIKNPKHGYVRAHMTNNEAVYSVQYKSSTATHKIINVFEYKAPLFNRVAIPYTDIDASIPLVLQPDIKHKYRSRLQQAIKKPDFDKQAFLKTLALEEQALRTNQLNQRIQTLAKGLLCKKKIELHAHILQYPDHTIAINMRMFKDHPLIKKIKHCDSEYHLLKESPNSFDKTVMGNTLSSNHFVSGYTSFGYNYITLTLDEEITKTKVKNTAGGDGLTIIFKSEKKLILQKNVYDFYTVTKNTDTH